MMGTLLKIGAIILALYVGGVLFLFVMQRSMIFFPDKATPQPINGAQVISVKTDDGYTLEGWYFPPRDHEKPVILFFHGNAGHYGHRAYKAAQYVDQGYGVLLAGYRGYGGNPGTPSEQGFYKDGHAYMAFLQEEQQFAAHEIVIYGESIGTGTAVEIATHYDARALVLETPFSSLVDVAAHAYFFVPVRALIKDRFMNVEKIPHIEMPVLILHGYQDQTIPFHFAKKLYNAAEQPKEFIEFPQGGHNDLYDYDVSSHVQNFLTRIAQDNEDNR